MRTPRNPYLHGAHRPVRVELYIIKQPEFRDIENRWKVQGVVVVRGGETSRSFRQLHCLRLTGFWSLCSLSLQFQRVLVSASCAPALQLLLCFYHLENLPRQPCSEGLAIRQGVVFLKEMRVTFYLSRAPQSSGEDRVGAGFLLPPTACSLPLCPETGIGVAPFSGTF